MISAERCRSEDVTAVANELGAVSELMLCDKHEKQHLDIA